MGVGSGTTTEVSVSAGEGRPALHWSRRWLVPLLMGGAFGLASTACRPSPSPVETTLEPAPQAELILEPTAPPAGQVTTASGIHEQLLPPNNLRYTVAVPDGYDSDRPVPLILALHYGGSVTPFYGKGLLLGLVEPALRELGAIIVAPDNVAGGWTNPESEANVLALLDAVQNEFNIDQKRTLIMGYSMGGMGTWYLAERNPERFAAAIPIAGRPQEGVEERDWIVPLFAIHGRDDELISLAPTETAVSALQAKGFDATLRVVDGLTHYDVGGFVEPLRDTIPWIRSTWESQ